MTREHTFRPPRVTERQKARVRLPVLILLALFGPPLVGVHAAAVLVIYTVIAVLYSLWTVRLVHLFSSDRRLGYFLCLTDAAILLPLMAWGSAAGLRVALILICAAGLAATLWADHVRTDTSAWQTAEARSRERARARELVELEAPSAEIGLERAVRARFRILTTNGARFGLVVLRVLRFEETASYYGEEASMRVLSALGRRGLRLLGPDAQRFVLPGGRIAFLFETEPDTGRVNDRGEGGFSWSGPYDVEGLAMTLGRRVCEHLIDGRRVECVVGWASAPADGMGAEDLLYVAESGAQSTAAFRRVAGPQVPVSQRARAAAG